MKNNSPAPVKPKSWLLLKSRAWHKWGGLFAGLFILLTAASGIVLNYKQPIFSALGLEKPLPQSEKAKPEVKFANLEFSTGRGLAALPVSLDRALEIARAEWGDVPLERIELKSERGELLYKLKQQGGAELWVNATTGTHFAKGQYERIGKTAPNGVPMRSTDWGKILIDLHTGKIGGEVGKAIMSLAAVLMLLLTFSGVYMWLKPLLIRRQNARAKTAPGAQAAVVSGPMMASLRKPERNLVEA